MRLVLTPQQQACGSGPVHRDVLWEEASGSISFQHGNKETREQGFSQAGRTRETHYEAQMLGIASSSYFSLEAIFLRIKQGVRKERRGGHICPVPGEWIN